MLYNVSTNAADSARSNMIDALMARKNIEISNNPADKVIAQIEGKYLPAARKLDYATLAYAAAIAFDFIPHLTSSKQTGAMFNVYALTKLWGVMRVLNGSTLDTENDAQEETVAGVVLAIARGVTIQKTINNALNDYMNRDGKRGTYSSGNAQATSALRALEVFGIVKNDGRQGSCKVWGIANAALFQRMLDGARGIPAVNAVPADDTVTFPIVSDNATDDALEQALASLEASDNVSVSVPQAGSALALIPGEERINYAVAPVPAIVTKARAKRAARKASK